jgi:hypothetical protein
MLAEEHERLSGMYSDMERERAALYERFEETIEAVKKRSDFRNLLLEKKLADLQADYEARQTTLSEVLCRVPPAASPPPPSTLFC